MNHDAVRLHQFSEVVGHLAADTLLARCRRRTRRRGTARAHHRYLEADLTGPCVRPKLHRATFRRAGPCRPERRAHESIFLRCNSLARTIAGSRGSSGRTCKHLISRSSSLLLRGFAIRTRCMSHPPGNAWCAVHRQRGPSVVRVHRRQHPFTGNSHRRTRVPVAVPRRSGLPAGRSSGRRQDEGSAVRHRFSYGLGSFRVGDSLPDVRFPARVPRGEPWTTGVLPAMRRQLGSVTVRGARLGRCRVATPPSMPRSTPNA